MKSARIISMTAIFSITFVILSVSTTVSSPEIDSKVKDLLSKMTLEEKVGQMTQVTIEAVSAQRGTVNTPHRLDEKKLEDAIINHHVGSIINVYDAAHTVDYWHEVITKIQDLATKKTRLRIPVLYGIDAIHGANYTMGSTLFPQSIAMAATRNPNLVKREGEITAYEVRASGIPWNFNPVLGVGRNPLWPRLFETYGEDPYLATTLGMAYVNGLEGDDHNIGAHDKVAACIKHYMGYSFPLSGKDRTPAWIPERMLRDIFLPPFKGALENGVLTVMANSSEINGIPTHSDYFVLTEILRNEIGFQGFVVSDWEDINRLYSRDKVASSRKEAVRMAVMAGVDMSMVPYDFSFYDDLLELAKEGSVPMSRIDEAVKRILMVKFRLGLFDNPYPDQKMKEKVGNPEFAQVSLQAARESITLLKNDNGFLPLSKNSKVLVTGPNANLRSVLNGGWTYTWQGNEEALYPKEKKTILEAIQAMIDKDNVKYVDGSTFDKAINIDKAVELARSCDVAVVCIGEEAYCETPGNIDDLTLPDAQLHLVTAIQKTKTPVVLVLVEGRPRIITSIVDGSKSILMAYLPGPEGGQVIADVLFGDFNPCGKLPITYPRHTNDLVCYDHKAIEVDDPNKLNPLYPFGHGLSYTTFGYSNLKIEKNSFDRMEPINIEVTITNTGTLPGKENVQVFVSDLVRSVSPPVKQLKRFEGVTLQPKESKTIKFTLNEDDFAFHGRDNKRTVESGSFKVSVGNLSATFDLLDHNNEVIN